VERVQAAAVNKKEYMMNIEQYGITMLYALIYIALLVVLKYTLNAKSSGHYVAYDELSKGNMAVGMRRCGAILGFAIAMTGVYSGTPSESLSQDLMQTVIYGFVAIAFMVSSLVITDRIVLPGVNNLEKLKSGNLAVGFVEFSMLISTGIIAYSSIYGDGGSILSSLSYFVAGQVVLVLLVLFYERFVVRNFNIVDAISKGRTASGIYLGSKLIAYSLILKSAISGNATGSSIPDMAIEFVSLALMGMVVLYLFEKVIDFLIVTSTSVREILVEDKVVPAAQLASAKIGIALVLSIGIL
jgi:uncharacterized membrane protein YjfL (UPF0719 family)